MTRALFRTPGALLLAGLLASAAFACSGSSADDESSDDALTDGYKEDPRERALKSNEDGFKYGSVGSDTEAGIPLLVFRALPRAFPELLPKGREGDSWAAFGFVEEPNELIPVGFSLRNYQFINRVGPNCAACHVSTYRTTADGQRQLAVGGASSRTDVQGFLRFVAASAESPDFTSRLVKAMDDIARDEHDLTWLVKRPLVHKVLLPLTQKGIKKNANTAWMKSRPDWGAGRIDPFNPVKFGMLKLQDDGTIGNSDMLPIWGVKDERVSGGYHWDGLSTNLRDVYLSSALGDGATVDSIEVEHLDKMRGWMSTVTPPKFPGAIDAAKAQRGEALYREKCTNCHGDELGSRSIVPPDQIGTDPNRLAMWTQEAVTAYNAYSKGQPWALSHFRKTGGYLVPELRGTWLTGPYLHNGSVPNLRALLEPQAKRPKTFTRGYDVIDTKDVGFITDERAKGAGTYTFDTTVKGNSNAGHEGPLYGTDLPDADKDALVEYLKTR